MIGELAVAIAAAGAAGIAGMGPHGLRLAHTRRLVRRCEAGRVLVLTYDDGPGTELTPRVMDLLAPVDAKATFFLLGRRVPGNERIVQRLCEAGHEIGCHGQDHVNAWKSWPWTAVRDIDRGYQTLSPWVAPDGLFRPPHGKLTLPTWWAVHCRGARFGWWTIDSGDTHETLPEPETVADAVARAGGGVVLMHDFDRTSQRQERAEFVLRTTELLLQTARREGLTICRYSDLWRPPAAQPASACSQLTTSN